MRRRVGVALAILVTVLSLSVFTGSPPASAAYDWKAYIPERWFDPLDPQGLKVINLYHPPYISGDFRLRIFDGARAWNAVGSLTYFKYISNTDQGTSCGRGYNRSMIFMGTIDGTGGTRAVTQSCVFIVVDPIYGTRISNEQIKFDNAESWYTGTSQFPPSNMTDTWSVAAHEFGHAIGWGNHFLESGDACPNDSWNPSRATMCPNLIPGDSSARSLATDDIVLFRGAYGPPFPMR